MSIHDNSTASLDALKASGTKLRRRYEVFNVFETAGRPLTDRVVMQVLGFKEPNAVRPRVTELRNDGLLVEVWKVWCEETKRHVRTLERTLLPYFSGGPKNKPNPHKLAFNAVVRQLFHLRHAINEVTIRLIPDPPDAEEINEARHLIVEAGTMGVDLHELLTILEP